MHDEEVKANVVGVVLTLFSASVQGALQHFRIFCTLIELEEQFFKALHFSEIRSSGRTILLY